MNRFRTDDVKVFFRIRFVDFLIFLVERLSGVGDEGRQNGHHRDVVGRAGRHVVGAVPVPGGAHEIARLVQAAECLHSNTTSTPPLRQ